MTGRSPLFIRVFGELAIEARGGPVTPPRGQVATLLRVLLARPNEIIGAEDLIERVWPESGDEDPTAARSRLYVLVNRLRRFLDDARGGDMPGRLEIVTENGGYRLVAGPADIDRLAFEAAAARSGRGAVAGVDDVMTWWRGEPYADFPDTEDVRVARDQLHEVRRVVEERHASPSAPHYDLARTRLLHPSASSDLLVPRSDLVDRIGRVGEEPVVAIVAPAGYGKTLLLAQWTEAQPGPVAWVSLEPEDDDPVIAWSAIAQSLQMAGVVADNDVPTDTVPSSPRHVAAIAAAIRAAAAREGPVALVLDDAHLARRGVATSVFELQAALVGQLKVVLASRPGADVLASIPDTAIMIGTDDLRFGPADIEELSDRVGAENREDLGEVTAGWPIAVSYLCRSGSHPSSLDVARLTLDTYIVAEVLDRLPAPARRLLVETAPLDWLTGDLCDAVSGRSGSASLLARLRDQHVLVAESSGATGWYRCHPLVREVLRELAEGDPSVDVNAVRRRAAHWYVADEMPERALEYAIAGGDDELVIALAGEVIDRAIAAPQLNTCVRWIRSLDPDVIAADRGTHDFLTVAASMWLGPDDRSRWVRSRRRHFGDDDLILMANAADDAYRDGRAGDSVAISERALTRLDRYFDRHRSFPGYRRRLTRYFQLRRTCGRMLAGAIDADAAELHALATDARSAIPAMSLWLYGEWAFLALVEGRGELAGNLIDGVSARLAAVDEQSAHLIAGRLVVAQALIASSVNDDVSDQRAVIHRLRAMADRYRRMRWTSELVPPLLALHAIEWRVGDRDRAIAARDEADLLLATFEDAPLLARARYVLAPESKRWAVGEAGPVVNGDDGLTDRERTVLALLVDSLTYREIADRLAISPHTVSGHVRSIYRKLGVRSRQGAVRRVRARSEAPGHLPG